MVLKKILLFLVLFCFCTQTAFCYESIIDGYFGAPVEQYKRFDDVPASLPAKEAIDYLYKYGIVSGGLDNSFRPDSGVTREQFVKILILAFGLYDETAVSSFTDSAPSDWHYPFISSAKKINMVNGISETYFGVGIGIQRQEMISMAYRVAKYRSYDFGEARQADYSDMEDVEQYAVEAVNAVFGIGAVPYTGANLRPSLYATRGEACMLIYQMLKNT